MYLLNTYKKHFTIILFAAIISFLWSYVANASNDKNFGNIINGDGSHIGDIDIYESKYLGSECIKAVNTDYFTNKIERKQNNKINTIGTQGINYFNKKQYNLALKELNIALRIAKNIKDFNYIHELLNHISNVHFRKNEFYISLKKLREAFKYAKETKDPSGQASILFAMGQSYGKIDEYDIAKRCYQASYERYITIGDEVNSRKAEMLLEALKIRGNSNKGAYSIPKVENFEALSCSKFQRKNIISKDDSLKKIKVLRFLEKNYCHTLSNKTTEKICSLIKSQCSSQRSFLSSLHASSKNGVSVLQIVTIDNKKLAFRSGSITSYEEELKVLFIPFIPNDKNIKEIKVGFNKYIN